MSILVAGGADFISSNFVLDWLARSGELVINLDKLTYAGNLENLQSLNGDQHHVFVKGDIGDSALVANLLAEHQPRAIISFAVETNWCDYARYVIGTAIKVGKSMKAAPESSRAITTRRQ